MNDREKRDYHDVGALDKAAANIEIVRDAYRGADAGDFERFYASYADDAVTYEAEGIPYGGVWRGKEACQRLTKALFNAWESVGWNVLEITGGGDLVIVDCEMLYKPKNGESIKHRLLELWRLRDGKTVEVRPFYHDSKLIHDVLTASYCAELRR